MRVRVLALGTEHMGDDRAALDVARALGVNNDVSILGRPGVGLLDELESSADDAVILLDAVRGIGAGSMVVLSLDELLERGVTGLKTSSHELAAVESLRLARALGRRTPRGMFVGIGGVRFAPGAPMSPEVSATIAKAVDMVRMIQQELRSRSVIVEREGKEDPCTNMD